MKRSSFLWVHNAVVDRLRLIAAKEPRGECQKWQELTANPM
jgi:hypothetical protein